MSAVIAGGRTPGNSSTMTATRLSFPGPSGHRAHGSAEPEAAVCSPVRHQPQPLDLLAVSIEVHISQHGRGGVIVVITAGIELVLQFQAALQPGADAVALDSDHLALQGQ